MPGVIDDHEPLPVPARDFGPGDEEAHVEALVGQRIDEFLVQRLVADLDGPQEHGEARPGGPVGFQVRRVLALLAREERLVREDEPVPLGLIDEPWPELRVGDGDERHGPLPDVLPVEITDAVFRDHVVDVSPVVGHPGARGQERHDAGHAVALRRGRQHEDGPAGRRGGYGPHEVGVPPDAAVEFLSDGLGGCLSGQVDLKGGVDGHHVRLPRDDGGIVGVVHGHEGEGRVVVDVVVYITGSQAQRRDGPARVRALLCVVHDAAPHEVDDAAAEQLGVYPEMFLPVQGREHGVRHPAVPDLDGAPVRDDPGNERAYP
ncbi:MAG: hypothetical protein BWX71_01373 [Deltaproteobacteria bacterium ADurb.Bin072]|nr:MAG: hypothetical protein BWX71_01373 [Deltaproteobacteria bacterium ADurb.Bin072]